MPHLTPAPFSGVRFRIVLESMDTPLAVDMLKECLKGFSATILEPVNEDGIIVAAFDVCISEINNLAKVTMPKFRAAASNKEYSKEIDFGSFVISVIGDDFQLDAVLFYMETLRAIFDVASMKLLLTSMRATNKALAAETVRLSSVVSNLQIRQKNSDEIATYAFYSREAVHQTLAVISEQIVSLGGEELGPLTFTVQSH